MKERILDYRRRIDALLEKRDADVDWKGVLEEHLVQVSFFQHERLIHLIVTVLFALLLMGTIGIALIADYMPMLLVSLLVLCLLAPYISHYFLLENEVQKMYEQYDKMLQFVKARE